MMRERMKSALKRLLTAHPSNKHDKITVKQEEAFYMKRYNQQNDKNKMHNNHWKANLQLNLTNRNGQMSRCFVCNSKEHWANNCLHNNQNVNLLEDDWDNSEEENIVLPNKHVDKNEIFSAETYKSVVTEPIQ